MRKAKKQKLVGQKNKKANKRKKREKFIQDVIVREKKAKNDIISR